MICVLLGICLASKLENDMYNNKPIIGVFAYPSEFYGSYPSDDYNYIAASYIKWSE